MTRNANDDALKAFVDRLFNIEDEFRNAKLERADLVKDLMSEIKARHDETGVDAKEVKRLTKIRLDEAVARDEARQLSDDIELYDLLYGASESEKADTEEDDI